MKAKQDKKRKENVVKEKVVEEIKKNSDEYIYVYGITNNKNFKLDIKGIRGDLIKKTDLKDISALISFYPNLNPVVKESEAMRHAEILNKLARKITIIPMAFGTVFKEKEILEAVITKSYPAIKKTLDLIKDKIELGVKVIKNKSEEIEELSRKIDQDILEELNKLSVKSIRGDLFSERLILNHSFLVERNQFNRFSNKIGDLEERYSDLKFIYTGPWPAYSFININVKAG